MSCSKLSLALTLLAAAAPAFAGDLDQAVDVGRATWSTASVGVICDAQASRERIQELARLMGGGTLTVADVRHLDNVPRAAGALRLANPAFMVLLPDDPLVRDGSFAGTAAVRAMASYAVPTLATTRAALQQGVAAAIGQDTQNQLILNHDLKGTVIVLPTGPMGASNKGTATIVYLAER